MARHKGRRRRRQPAFRGGLLLVVLVIAVPLLVWGGYSWLQDDDGDGDDPSASHEHEKVQPTETPEPEDDAGPDTAGSSEQDAIDACVSHLEAGFAVVDEAATGADHWGTHIGARAAWLAGEISDEEKAARYKRTRLAGPDDQDRFKSALAKYQEAPTCDDLAALDGDAATACVERADLITAAIDTGTKVMEDWEGHLHAMGAFADHEMTSDEANAMWVEAAETAPPRINAFEDARDDLKQAPECAGGST